MLPAAVTYDLLISPFVLYAVVLAGGYARWGTERPGGPAQRPGTGRGGRGPARGRGRWRGARHRGGPVPAAAGRRRAPHRRLDRRQPGSARPAGRRVGGPAPPAAAAAARRHGRVRGGAPAGQRQAGPAAGHGQPAAWHPAAARRGRRGQAVPGRGRAGHRVRRPCPELGRPVRPAARRRAVRRPVGPRPGTWPQAAAAPAQAGQQAPQGHHRRRQVRHLDLAGRPGPAAADGPWLVRERLHRAHGGHRGAFGGRPRGSGPASRKPAAALRTAAPRFRRPGARWKRAGRTLGSRGASPRLRAPRWRRKFSRLGKGGLR